MSYQKTTKPEHRKEVADARTLRKSANRTARKEELEKSFAIDEEIRRKNWAETITKFGQNRRSRRQFKKIYGFMLPAFNTPYVKSALRMNVEEFINLIEHGQKSKDIEL